MNTLLPAAILAAVTASEQSDSNEERIAKLFRAMRQGDAASVRALLDAHPEMVDAQAPERVPAVRMAFYYRQPAIAAIFVERGAKLAVPDAAAAGELARLSELLDREPGLVNRFSDDGAAPLGLAAFFGQTEAVRLLLDRGAHINAVNTNPAFAFTALHSAMSAGHVGIVKLLLERGADVNTREAQGMTAMHEAAGIGNIEYVQLLLDRGADATIRTNDGKSAADFARSRGHHAIADLLERAKKR